MNDAAIAQQFRYKPPVGDKAERHKAATDICIAAAQALNAIFPDGRNKSLVMTHMELVKLYANSGIANDLPEEMAAGFVSLLLRWVVPEGEVKHIDSATG